LGIEKKTCKTSFASAERPRQVKKGTGTEHGTGKNTGKICRNCTQGLKAISQSRKPTLEQIAHLMHTPCTPKRTPRT